MKTAISQPLSAEERAYLWRRIQSGQMTEAESVRALVRFLVWADDLSSVATKGNLRAASEREGQL